VKANVLAHLVHSRFQAGSNVRLLFCTLVMKISTAYVECNLVELVRAPDGHDGHTLDAAEIRIADGHCGMISRVERVQVVKSCAFAVDVPEKSRPFGTEVSSARARHPPK
jgi:hypothetical protein